MPAFSSGKALVLAALLTAAACDLPPLPVPSDAGVECDADANCDAGDDCVAASCSLGACAYTPKKKGEACSAGDACSGTCDGLGQCACE